MSIISEITNSILQNNLSECSDENIIKALEDIFDPNIDDILKSSLLTAINFANETDYAALIYFLTKVLKNMSEQCPLDFPIYDIVGTGGDGKNTYNISTPASIICAGANIKMCKHGNRSSTSNSGSADVLEKLGANINLNSSQIQEVMENNDFCFVFAPQFYKKMKHIMPVRKILGIKTIFNLIGPLINPTNPTGLLIGVSDINKADIIAKSLAMKQESDVLLVHSNNMDKISPYQETKYWRIKNHQIKKGIINPSEFGLQESNSENYFKGGANAIANAQKILEILMNIEQGPIRDFVLVHSAILAVLANLVTTPEEAMVIMRESIKSGKALEQLNNYVRISNKFSKKNFLDKIISRRKLELNIQIEHEPIENFILKKDIKPLNCYEILKNNSINIIGEIKRSSPSEGNINSDININEVVTDYIDGGVTGISILTENVWFGGSLKDIKSVRKQIENIPNRPFILRKDFIFSRYQVFESYIAGVNTLLLIYSLQKYMIEYKTSLKDLIRFSKYLGMEPIVEIYDINELELSINAGAKIIGINNRNLKTFQVNLEVSENIMKYVHSNSEKFENVIFISFSGISSNKNIQRLKKYSVKNFLIGTSLMKSDNKTKFLKKLVESPEIE